MRENIQLTDTNMLMEKARWIIRSDGTRVFAIHAEDVEDAPRVDAVEVVRCKDCTYATNNYLVHGLCLCEKPMYHVVHGERPKNALMCEDDFCSYGERREVE